MNLGKLDVDTACGARGQQCGVGESFVADSTTAVAGDSLTLTGSKRMLSVSFVSPTDPDDRVPPVMHHVGINSVLQCHTSYRCSGCIARLYNLSLLGDASPLPLGMLDLRDR